MKRKALIVLFTVLLSGGMTINGQNTGKNTIDIITSGYSAKAFRSDPVSDKDILQILQCGIKAPSARNSQLWRFTVVKDNKLNAEIIKDVLPGNILIVISGQMTDAFNVDFDCALATQNMYIAAQALGLGAHIYGSPVKDINSTKKQILGIPEDYRAVTVLRIGHIDNTVDATSSASPRKKMEEVVNYK